MENDLPAIKKFAETSIWDFKRALEVALSELGIEGIVPGVYDLNYKFMALVKEEQDKAREYLKSIDNNNPRK
jgi:hypothetical protein